MKLPDPQVQPAPPVPALGASSLTFPKRTTLAVLRMIRDRHFKAGSHEFALQVAAEVAKRAPGRESYFRKGVLLREVGRYREALTVLRDALRFRKGARYLIADIYLHIAHTWMLLGNRKRVNEAVRRSHALRIKPRSAFNFHMVYGNHLLSKRRYRAAYQEYILAEQSSPNAMGRGRAAINQGIVLIRQWDYGAAMVPLDRSIRILKKAGHAADLAIARAARAGIYSEQGRHRRAIGMFLRAGRTFRRLGKMDREAEVLLNAASSAGVLGLWAKARAILDRAISLSSATGQQTVLSCAYANRALACAHGEEFEMADANLAQARRLASGTNDWIANLHVSRAAARMAAISGDWVEMFRVARRAEQLAARLGDAVRVVEFRKLRAEAEDQMGRWMASSIARSAAGRLEVLIRSSTEQSFERTASRLAGSDIPILILGEAGTDKLGTAKVLHRASRRAKGPCVVVPCEQLRFPASDLYGHAAGAWSGANRAAVGFVQAAEGGTLILDCVDQLSISDQRILIPLLDGRIRKVGGIEEKAADLRVVATCTSIDGLCFEVRTRLEGAILRIPALKEQKSLIPHQVATLLGGRRRITPDAVVELSRHSWNGNFTELRSVVDRLVALSNGMIGRKLVRRVLASSPRRSGTLSGRSRTNPMGGIPAIS